MDSNNHVVRRGELPEIVKIVLHQITRRRAAHDITQERFDAQLGRLAKEELEPRGLSVLVSELREGHTHFLIKDRNGPREVIECNGTCHPVAESEESEPSAYAPPAAPLLA